MPRKPKKQPAQNEPTKSFDEFVDDSDVIDDEVLTVDDALDITDDKSRDWRDVEKYKEERALKRLVDDDFDLDDL